MGFVECKASCLLPCLVGISLIIVLEIDAEIVDGKVNFISMPCSKGLGASATKNFKYKFSDDEPINIDMLVKKTKCTKKSLNKIIKKGIQRKDVFE